MRAPRRPRPVGGTLKALARDSAQGEIGMGETRTGPAAQGRATLDYPFGRIPQAGETVEVMPGVLWIRMPLPLALSHINLWALRDGDGWTIVDTGLRTPDTAAAWCQLGTGALQQHPVTRVVVTHMHPDHVGMAGWLCRKFDCRLWMTRLEYLTCRVLAADATREAPEEGVDFYRRAGWDDTALENYRARFGNFGKGVYALPDSYRRMRDGESFAIGDHSWRVVVGSGHSPEHACLYCAELKVLISGDQVLPKISSNVGVHPTEPDADPVTDWLASLARLKREIPDDVLVLPAHNEPFRGLHARLDELADEQSRALDRARLALAEPKRVTDLFEALFSRPIKADPMTLFLATGEALACLNHLLVRDEVCAETDPAGTDWYRAVRR